MRGERGEERRGEYQVGGRRGEGRGEEFQVGGGMSAVLTLSNNG